MNFTSYKKFYFHCLANVKYRPQTNKGFEKSFPQRGFKKSPCDHYITIIFYQQENLEAMIQTRFKGYYNNAIIIMRISLDGYDSKIRKVSRCRPTVSN